MRDKPQWLGRLDNPLRYMDLIDNPESEGYQIRQHVIFPNLFSLIRETTGITKTPIVDFGSGTGSLTARLSKKLGINVEGIDVSSKFVDIAKQNYPQHLFYRTIRNAPVGYSLHNANAHLVFHTTPHQEKLLENIVDATQPDGYIFITIPHPQYFKNPQHWLANNSQPRIVKLGGQAKMTYYFISIDKYEDMFQKAGLKILSKKECFAPIDAPDILEKYKKQPGYIVYALQKKIDEIDTAMITHCGSGKILLLTRSVKDDKFPGAKSFFSCRRNDPKESGLNNLMQGLQKRIGMTPDYISSQILGSLLVKHKHRTKIQRAKVNLYAAKITGSMPKISNERYSYSQFISPHTLRPFGGACTQLGYEFLKMHN